MSPFLTVPGNHGRFIKAADETKNAMLSAEVHSMAPNAFRVQYSRASTKRVCVERASIRLCAEAVVPCKDASKPSSSDGTASPTSVLSPQTSPRSLREAALSEHATVFEASLNINESLAVQRFRERLRSISTLSGSALSFWDNPLVAHRFCQARDFNVDRAVEMFEKHLTWREELGLSLVDRGTGPQPRLLLDFQMPELSAVQRARRFCFHKVDRKGRPVMYDKAGELTISKLKAALPPGPDGADRWFSEYLRYFVWSQEATLQYRLPAASLAAGRLVHTSIYVMDMSGFAFTAFTSDYRALLKAATTICTEHYPGTMERVFLINVPVAFRAVWAFVRKLLPRDTALLVSLLGGRDDYLPKLLEYIDRASLPDWLGGDDDTCDFGGVERGPWAGALPWPSLS